MDTSLLGLGIIVTSLGILFFTWTQVLKSRAKTIDDVENFVESSGLVRSSSEHNQNFALNPSTPEPERNQAHGSNELIDSEQAPEEAATTSCIAAPALDEMAETHLAIALQFFDTGDFEGAIEMSELVVENTGADQSQIEKAKRLISLSQ